MTWYLYLSLIKLKIRISPCQVKLLEWLAKKSVRLHHGHRLSLRHMLLKIIFKWLSGRKNKIWSSPSTLSHPVSNNIRFWLLWLQIRGRASATVICQRPWRVIHSWCTTYKRSLDNPSLGMRFPKLLFSSHESNFFTIFTLVCLSHVDRNV